MKIILTLDYELYMGKITGTPENCLVKPMDALTEAVAPYHAKFVIFADAAYLLRLYQLKDQYPQLQKDYDTVSRHIRQLAADGHDIQLHFHPQWIYSHWNETEKKWCLDYAHYKLSDMEPDFARQTFAEAKRLLDSLLPLPTKVFRAGGYCLDTYKDFPDLFKENGLIADSSVARGQFRLEQFHSYDYRTVPDKTIYRFKYDLTLEEANGPFLEFSISSISLSYINFVFSLRRKLRKYKYALHYGDGISIGNSIEKRNSKRSVASRLFSTIRRTASIDGSSSMLLQDFYDKCMSDGSELVVIGHPKEATDTSIVNLVSFLRGLSSSDQVVTTKYYLQ